MNQTNANPLVSICCITYNHEPYIRDAIEGFLMQKTNFPVEILIHDDASTDGTADIIREYEAKYPDIIKPIYQTENQYSKGIKISQVYQFSRARGKYIALCEGDDYWIDPYKLQKQVDFLEANPEYGMVHTEHNYIDEVNHKILENRWLNSNIKNIEENDCAPLLLSDKYWIATCTVMARTEIIKEIIVKYKDDFTEKFLMGDNQLWFHLSRSGKIKYFNEATAVYRRHEGGVTSMFSLKKRYDFIKNVYYQKRYFAEKYNYNRVIPVIDKNYLSSLIILSKRLNKKDDYKLYLKKFKKISIVSYKDIIKLKIKTILINNKNLNKLYQYIKSKFLK